MPAWAPFAGFILVLVAAVIWLARRSAALIRDTRLPASEPTEISEAERAGSALTPSVLLVNVALTQGLVIAILGGGMIVAEIPWQAAGLGGGTPRTSAASVGLGLVLGIGLWVGSEAAGRVADVAGFAYDERLRGRLAPHSTGGWTVLYVFVLPLVAVGEELLFRGALIGVVATGFDLSPWLLAGISTVAFAVSHGAQGRVGIVTTGALGAALAIAFVRTDSLVVVIVGHYVVNAVEFAVHEVG